MTAVPGGPPRVAILGGGYVGLYTAMQLERELSPGQADLVLVSPHSYMTYQPFLPEATAGNIEPRHTVVPLRSALKRTRLISARVLSLDHGARRVTIKPVEGEAYALPYDIVIWGIGSVSRVLPVPGLADAAVGFRTVGEAIFLRNQVLERLDAAESTDDPELRRRALTFLFVGGGYAGVEALAELEELATYACRSLKTLRRADMRWVLVEAAGGILPEVGGGLGEYAIEVLRGRGIEVHLNTRLESAEGGVARLSDGQELRADTLVWTTGVKAHPAAARSGLAADDKGRLITDEHMRVRGAEDAWAAGDCAAVPDAVSGGTCPPTAQFALRQARRLGSNVAAQLKGEDLTPFRYRNLGLLVSLGRYQGVARVLGIRMKGVPAWVLHRAYHLLMIPTLGRKCRVALDWTVALLFRRDVVQLGELTEPRGAFREAIGPTGGE
ncbi:NAD(P)/FAD-dependent oxidoreductase [soil metagenome]